MHGSIVESSEGVVCGRMTPAVAREDLAAAWADMRLETVAIPSDQAPAP